MNSLSNTEDAPFGRVAAAGANAGLAVAPRVSSASAGFGGGEEQAPREAQGRVRFGHASVDRWTRPSARGFGIAFVFGGARWNPHPDFDTAPRIGA